MQLRALEEPFSAEEPAVRCERASFLELEVLQTYRSQSRRSFSQIQFSPQQLFGALNMREYMDDNFKLFGMV